MNYSKFNDSIFGLQQEDVVIEDTKTIDELNTRLQSRHFSDSPMQPYFTPRPTPTKYSRFPMVERRANPTVAIQHVATHHPSSNFNPGTRPYGFKSYLASYDHEVSLRQPMNRLEDIKVYVPHSNSELFHMRMPECVTRNEEQTHPLLFERPHIRGRTLDPFVNDYIGKAPFLNATLPQSINY